MSKDAGKLDLGSTFVVLQPDQSVLRPEDG